MTSSRARQLSLLLVLIAAPAACGREDRIEDEEASSALAPGTICVGNPPWDLQPACCHSPGRDRPPADGDGDGLFDRCEQAVAEKFAPIIYHSSDESNWPANVDWMLARTTLSFYDDGCTPDFHRQMKARPSQQDLLGWTMNGGCGSRDTVSSSGTRSMSKQRTFYLNDVGGGDRAGSRDSADWTTYVHAFPNTQGGVTIQYWRMYPYNDAANNHGGDWEGEFVILDRGLRPTAVALMGHSGIEHRSPGDFVWETNHVRVFSEGGGHATGHVGGGIAARGCPPSRASGCGIDPANPLTFIRQETWPGGAVNWPDGRVSSSGQLLNVGSKVQPLNGQVFLQYSGLWGSPGTFDFTSGYWGPAFNETSMVVTHKPPTTINGGRGQITIPGALDNVFNRAWCYDLDGAPAGECSPAALTR